MIRKRPTSPNTTIRAQWPNDREPLVHPFGRRAHLAGLRVLEEVLREPSIALVERGADQNSPGDADDPGTARPAEHTAGRLGRTRRAAPGGTEQDLDRQHAEERVCDPAAECSDPVEPTVRLFGPVAQEDVHEAPQGVAGKADRDGYEEEPAERLVRDRLQRSALVGGLPAGAECELERQDPDDPVDEAPGGEPGASEHLEGSGLPDVFSRRLELPDGGGLGSILDAHHAAPGTHSVTAAGSTLTLNDFTFVRSPPSSS